MKVEQSTVVTMKITDVPALDPITVFLEDIEPRRGRITIRCYDKAWTAYWGGMGDNTVSEFFCSCDEHYLAGNLSVGLRSEITDSDCIQEAAFKEIISMRRGRFVRSFRTPGQMVRVGRNDISADEARELWDEVDFVDFGSDGWNESELMQKIFGDEWWHRLPTKPNPEYQYLCRIIKAVQEGLRMAQQEKEPQAA